MAFTPLIQRGRNCDIVRSGLVTTTGIVRGLTYDGVYLWASSSGGGGLTPPFSNLVQIIPTPAFTVVREVPMGIVETYDDICFDGEYFWGPVSGNAGIAQLTRSGQRVNFIGSVFSQSPVGIAFDGAFLWVVYSDGVGGRNFSMIDRQPSSVLKTFNSSLSDLTGLTFDGEFLVSRGVVGTSQTLYYFTREGQLVKTATESSASGTLAFNGLAWDGESFYQGFSV